MTCPAIPITKDELYSLGRQLAMGKDKYGKAQYNGNGVTTCCPLPGHGKGNGDENPSLWLGISEHGNLVVHCKADCDKADIYAALEQYVTRPERAFDEGREKKPSYKPNGKGPPVNLAEWVAMDYAPANTSIGDYWKAGLGKTDRAWIYRDIEGQRISCIVCRWDKPDGDKVVSLRVWCRNRKTKAEAWQWLEFPKTYHLYNIHLLKDRPEDTPVLIVEGEPTRDAANKLFGGRYFVTTWPSGASMSHQPNWSVLKGRSVVLWPDNDEPGRKAMRIIAVCLRKAGVEDVKMVVLE